MYKIMNDYVDKNFYLAYLYLCKERQVLDNITFNKYCIYILYTRIHTIHICKIYFFIPVRTPVETFNSIKAGHICL